MPSTPRPRNLFVLAIVLAAGLAALVFLRDRWFKRSASVPPPATRPVIPTSQPAPPPPPPPSDYLSLIRAKYPTLPTTRPLSEPLTYTYAARFILDEPVYLDSTRRLWITRPDAPPTAEVLRTAADQQVILTREKPVYVHWIFGDTEVPYLICLNASGTGFDVVTAKGRSPIGRGLNYDWSRSRFWDDRLVVPTDVGASVFTFGDSIKELQSPPLAQAGSVHAPVQITFSTGPLAWIPPEGEHPGSAGAVRCVEDTWFPLTPEQGWPAGLIHLVPLLDGSVLQLIAGPSGTVRLSVVGLDPMSSEEEKRLLSLINDLSDLDAAKREKAFDELTRYGPGLWRVAEQVMGDQPPETRARIRQLLRAKVSPLLGKMQLIDGRMRVIARFPEGGVLFYSQAGVSIPQDEQEPIVVTPAWLSALPGDSIRLLGPELVRKLDPDHARIRPWAGEWIVNDDQRGPMRLFGADLAPMLRKSDRRFSDFVGVARGGRFIFKEPLPPATQASTRPTTVPASSSATATTPKREDDEKAKPESSLNSQDPSRTPSRHRDLAVSSVRTLIIDPNFPDPTPRLPFWSLQYPTGTVGWDKNNWPAAKQGNAWALGDGEWRAIDEAKEPFFTDASQVPPLPPFPTTHPVFKHIPSTQSSTAPSTQPADPLSPAVILSQKPILLDPEGTWYFDGRETLTTIKPDGTLTIWPLPDAAIGEGEVHLIRTSDGTLFLFNEPGRVLRIAPTPGAAEPFRLDATFTRGVPSAEHPTRIWLDPSGRIDIAYDGTRLAILFPQGFIPPSAATLMPASDQEEE